MDSLDVLPYHGYLLRQKKPGLVEIRKVSTGECQVAIGTLGKDEPDALILAGKWKDGQHGY